MHTFPPSTIRLAPRARDYAPVLGRCAVALLLAELFVIVFMNFLFFPDCNRETRDCFLIEHLWGRP